MSSSKSSFAGVFSHPMGRRSFLKRAGALSGVAIIPAAGFGSRAFGQELTPMIHQLGWVKSIQFGGHFAAIHNGYFEEEGIAAEFLAGGPSGVSTETAVATGQATTSDTGVDGTIRARLAGLPVKAIGAIMQRTPAAVMSLASNPILSLADFPGKTIAMPDGTRPQFDQLMTANGMNPADVTYVPVGTDPGMLAAGQVDGYYGWATNQGVMLQARGVEINAVYMDELGVPGYAGVIIATDDTIANQRDDLIAWLRADIRGWQWHLDNPDEMAELMVSTYGQVGLDLQAQTLESAMMPEFLTIGAAAERGLLSMDPAVWEAGLQFSIAAGEMAEGDLTIDDVMTTELVEEAHATL